MYPDPLARFVWAWKPPVPFTADAFPLLSLRPARVVTMVAGALTKAKAHTYGVGAGHTIVASLAANTWIVLRGWKGGPQLMEYKYISFVIGGQVGVV